MIETAACSHGWRGLEVTKDGSMLEVNDGSRLRGQGRGRWGTQESQLRRRQSLGPRLRTEECSRKEGDNGHIQGDLGVETPTDWCLEILLSVRRERAGPGILGHMHRIGDAHL
jgi:hypothetical protein